MAKCYKLFISLAVCAFLTPCLSLKNTSATEVSKIPFEQVALPSGQETDLGMKCIVKADSATFSVKSNLAEPSFIAAVYDKTYGNDALSNVPVENTISVSPKLSPGRRTELTFSIKNLASTNDVFDSFLALGLGDNACYECTSPGGVIASYGDCNTDNDSQPNGASRILAPIAALLGGLLFLF